MSFRTQAVRSRISVAIIARAPAKFADERLRALPGMHGGMAESLQRSPHMTHAHPISLVRHAALMFFGAVTSSAVLAFGLVIPVPYSSKPATLSSLIDLLEKSKDTRALAYVSEDKLVGSKRWVWGYYSGLASQPEADRLAMSRCESALAVARNRHVNGKLLHDFGSNTCQLHSFSSNGAGGADGQGPGRSRAAPSQPEGTPINELPTR